MKATPIQTALLCLVIVLIAFTAAARIEELSLQKERRNRDSSLKKSFCMGVEHPETGLGFACAQTREKAIDEAVSKLNLPSDCEQVKLPAVLVTGEKLVLSERNGRCVFVGIERLPAGLRLLAGKGLNVNKDSVEELALLPGIGEVKARSIVEERDKNGSFKDAKDLIRVHGIGALTASRLEPWLEWE